MLRALLPVLVDQSADVCSCDYLRVALMMFRSCSSSQRSHHRQLSSSLSFRRTAASPSLEGGAAISGHITILRSPGTTVSIVLLYVSAQHCIPSKGGLSRSVTFKRRCSPCSRRSTASIEDSHHPREVDDSRLLQVASKSCSAILSVLAIDRAGSAMKGESSPRRSTD